MNFMIEKIKTLKIAGHIYKLIFPYRFKERTDLSAQADHQQCEIRISNQDTNGNNRAESNITEDLWHEIIHCIDEAYCAGSLTESQVTGLGQGLNQVLKDNFVVIPILENKK